MNKIITNGRKRLSWEETALKLAFNIADYRSEDPYVQVGAVIVKNDNSILLGYNGAPPGIIIDWSDRDKRRKRVIHAEENVLSLVKRGEVRIMAVTALPCDRCIGTCALKGIKRIFYRDLLKGYNHELTFELAHDFNIDLIQVNL